MHVAQSINAADQSIWDQKTACALRWIVMMTSEGLLSPASRRELSAGCTLATPTLAALSPGH
jgi:hypothetical protein